MKWSSLIRKALGVFALILVFGVQLGCETTQPTEKAAAPATGARTGIGQTDTTYSPGDKLTLEFDNGLQTPWLQVVREDGFITLPLNKSVRAANKKKGDLEQEIQKIYVPNILRRLTVNVRSEERSYFVQGEVRLPGQKPHTGLITALKAIAAAGDFTDFAKKSDVEILRSNGQKVHVNALKAIKDPATYDVPVYPGDTVHVPRRFF